MQFAPKIANIFQEVSSIDLAGPGCQFYCWQELGRADNRKPNTKISLNLDNSIQLSVILGLDFDMKLL